MNELAVFSSDGKGGEIGIKALFFKLKKAMTNMLELWQLSYL
jgi:hypothetical protein